MGEEETIITSSPSTQHSITQSPLTTAGPFLQDVVDVDGSALSTGDATINDDGIENHRDNGVTFGFNTGAGFSKGAAVIPHFVQSFVLFGNHEFVQSLTVYGSNAGENFTSTRIDGGTNLNGGSGDDTFNATGPSIYFLNGFDGSDHYIINWAANVNPFSMNIIDMGLHGSNTVEVNDAPNSIGGDVGSGTNLYTITDSKITRDGVPNLIGIFQQPTHAEINYLALNVGAKNLDTADSKDDATPGTVAPDDVNVQATKTGVPVTINTGSSPNSVHVAQSTGNLDSLASGVTVNGNTSSTVTIFDTAGGTDVGSTTYNTSRTRVAYAGDFRFR